MAEAGNGIGQRVAIGLGVLTVVEYALAVAGMPGLLLWLAVIAIAKAWLIVSFFMHIGQLRREERS